MRINPANTIEQNLVDAANTVSSIVFVPGDLTFGDPAIANGADQTHSNPGHNTTISITGVEARGYMGTITRQYRRVPLDAPVGGVPSVYEVPEGTTGAQLLSMVAEDRSWHAASGITGSQTNALTGTAGTGGTVTFTATGTNKLHIGTFAVEYLLTA